MKINVKEESFFSGYGIEKKDVFFILILILIAIFGFSFNASATTIFSEDFESYNIGDGQSVLRNNDKWYYYTFNSFRGVVSSDWYSSPDQSFYFFRGNTETRFDSNILDTPVSVGSFFYTINQTGHSTNGGLSFCTQLVGTLANPCHSFGITMPENLGIIRINDEEYLTTFTYPFYFGVDYNFRFDVDFINDKYSIFINNDLVADNVSFPSPKSFTSINTFSLSLNSSKVGALYYIDDIYLTDGSNPFVVGLPDCGSDDGLILNSTPTNLCNNGQADTPVFDGIKWDWSCSSGQVSEVCRAYSSTSNPINGSCGEWDGQDFDVWPDTRDLCDISASLIFPSMLETINSYTWTCSGFNGGISAYCSADKTTPSVFPELPAGSIDDCSSLGIPEVWFCNISNTIKSIFLPSADKITELNETINKISGRFPFSYINSSMSIISDISNNISEEDSLSLSIMGSESNTLYFEDIPFIHYIKIFTTILMSFLFIFWLIRFIKHIF